MSNRLMGALSPLFLAGISLAQVGPAQIFDSNTQTSPPGIDPATVGVSSIQQVNFVKDSNLPPGTWHCTLTVTGLPGSPGGADLLAGTYNPQTDTFTPNTDAVNFNSAAGEFGLMYNPARARTMDAGNVVVMDPACVAVWDNGTQAQLAYRANTSQPWTMQGDILNVPGGYVDPTLAVFNGELWFVWVGAGSGGQEIHTLPITINDLSGRATVPAQQPTILADTNQTPNGGTPHSPTPVTGGDGDTEAFVFDANASSDSDPFWKSRPLFNQMIFSLEDTTAWSNNGGLVGGTLFQAYNSPTYHVYPLGLGFLTGDDEDATRNTGGRRADVGLHVPILQPADVPFSGVLLIDTSLTPGPIPTPPIGNEFTLQYTGVIPPLIFPPVANHLGEAFLSFPVPGPLDGTVYCQGLVFRLVGTNIEGFWTNEAVLNF